MIRPPVPRPTLLPADSPPESPYLEARSKPPRSFDDRWSDAMRVGGELKGAVVFGADPVDEARLAAGSVAQPRFTQLLADLARAKSVGQFKRVVAVPFLAPVPAVEGRFVAMGHGEIDVPGLGLLFLDRDPKFIARGMIRHDTAVQRSALLLFELGETPPCARALLETTSEEWLDQTPNLKAGAPVPMKSERRAPGNM